VGRRFALFFVVTATSLLFFARGFSSVMAEPVLPPLPGPGPEPADDPVAAEPAVPPVEAAEPVVENEVIASLISCVLRSVFRVLCQRSPPLGCIIFICLRWFRSSAFHCPV